MKRVFFALAVIALATSCKKDKDNTKACYECITTSTINDANATTVKTEQCNFTQAQIDELERQSKSTVTNGDLTMKSSMKCTKK